MNTRAVGAHDPDMDNSPESTKIKKLIEEENTGIDVTVKNPQRRGGNIGGFFVYDVEGQDKQGGFSCKRRYNDFHELRSKLVENWPGIFIPPLPEKKTVVRKNKLGKQNHRIRVRPNLLA
jgi:hypothetical protein